MTKTDQTPDIPVADRTDTNWVDRFAPRATRPYLRLSRADRPAGTWLLLIPCWWGLALAILADPLGPTWNDLWIATGCAMGAFLMRGAGCTWNDISDRDFDAQVERTKSRPLPSGQVSVKGAALWMVVQALIAFCVLLTFNRFAIILGIAALIPVAIYPFAKRFTWWPQVFLGFAFNWGALLGWAAHYGSLSWSALALYAAGIAWTLFYDTIYAHQDTEDDALIGVKSTARRFGDASPRWLLAFQIICLILLLVAVLLANGHAGTAVSLAALTLAIVGIWAFGVHLTWQLRQLDIGKPEVCLYLFRANRDTGLILVLFWTFAIAVETLRFGVLS